MITFLNTPLIQRISSNIILILCITFINGVLLFATVACILGRVKQTPARYKHLIWLFLLSCFVAIPVFSILIPPIDILHARMPAVKTLSVENYTALTETDTRLSAPSDNRNIHDTGYRTSGTVTPLVEHIGTLCWQTAVMILWFMGVFLSLIRIVVGRIGLSRLIQGASHLNDAPFPSLMHTLCKRLGITKEVLVLGNSQCITPFTCFLLKPVILLPAKAVTWPEDRIRVVLLHELAHIKRRDFVSRVVARYLCAFFWFIPPVWIAYHRMQIEEEKACDASVIRSGVRASDYAGHIVDIARSTRGMVLSFMFQLFFGHHSTLEPRIRNILRLKRSDENQNWRVLIRSLLICFMCLLLLQSVNPVTARENGFFRKEAPIELLYGRWIDTHVYDHYEKVNVCTWPKKMLIDEDGSMHLYNSISSPELPHVGETDLYTVVENRIDRRGNHYYKLHLEYPHGYSICYVLIRIDPSGTTLELNRDKAEYPTHIDTDSFDYLMFDKS